MIRLTIIPLSAALLAGCMAQPYRSDAIDEEASAALAAELDGRVAGDPVSCIRSSDLEGNRGIDENTILFEARGSTVYVNHTRSACPALTPYRALRLRTTSTQICSGELVTVFDPSTGIDYGGCSLGDFVPYRRAG
jgi:hypothetical protein